MTSISQRGSLLLYVMVFGALAFSLVVVGVAGYAVTEHQAARYRTNQEEAFQIAEAGVEYYRWHLAHNATNYTDGTTSAGPYVHTYTNAAGATIGYFALSITPPSTGSTVVTISSTGWIASQTNSKRTVKVRVGFPALTDFAFLTNSAVWIGSDEVTHGKFQANGGIRYDGTSDAPVSSAVASYTCPSTFGCSGNPTKPGVWGSGGPSNLWSYPVPAEDFSAVTADLAQIKTNAQSNGLYFSSSGKNGWRLQFNSNGTLTAAKVTAVNCYSGKDTNGTTQNACIDIKTLATGAVYSIPTSSYIYVDDTVWVDGTVKGRATIGAGTGKNIIVDNNLLYAAKDGTSALGLISNQNVLVPHDAPSTMEIDAALLAQNGSVERYDYSNSVKTSLTTYGSLMSNGIWTWSWVDGSGNVVSGFQNTNETYDTNLTYSPPAGFPVGSTYNIISWEQVQ